MMAIKEEREAPKKSMSTPSTFAIGKMRTKNQPKQPFFLGGEILIFLIFNKACFFGNPYLRFLVFNKVSQLQVFFG